MKISICASLLSALYLSASPIEAFAPNQGTRLSNTVAIGGSKSSLKGSLPGASKRPRTALHVSFIQDRLREIGDSIDTDGSSSFMQQLKKPISFSQRELGLIVLLTVPIAWGTYASTVQSIYTLDPQVPGFIFSTFYFFVAASGSLLATHWNNNAQKQQSDISTSKEEVKTLPAIAGLELGFYVYLANFMHVIGLQTVPSDRAGFLFQCK